METSKPIETDVIACEIKISVTAETYQEIHELIERVREDCQSNYKLDINFSGEFFKG